MDKIYVPILRFHHYGINVIEWQVMFLGYFFHYSILIFDDNIFFVVQVFFGLKSQFSAYPLNFVVKIWKVLRTTTCRVLDLHSMIKRVKS